MGRPREFNEGQAVQKATRLFWEKGFAATSTDALLKEMDIGRQSLYNAFGGKRQLYLEALRSYQANTTAGHLDRLNEPSSPLAGIRQLLTGIAAEDDETRALGCLGVGSVSEFGTRDPELSRMHEAVNRTLHEGLIARIQEAKSLGEIDEGLSAERAAEFVLLTMTGLQMAARGGANTESMHRMAAFTVDRLAMS
ncbi:TetR/AcrR family transcriptional regulator [Streptomyces dioscori]|uniref:TetR/AcrR family transcriptional regulator n=1 Tax=Streptomyces dioscori TaxID=2109333 RepID=A0A2P8Q9R3_9ACTN|nr:TetR/AcrR family transcriptional regulator [Streptomyces dioscori]PSM42974.1 TetR/AcrR family transcriptional regulator [Streptomyces dioscori]